MVYDDIHLSNMWFKSVIRVYVVFMVFASLGLRPWDVNTIKTSIHPYNQHIDLHGATECIISAAELVLFSQCNH